VRQRYTHPESVHSNVGIDLTHAFSCNQRLEFEMHQVRCLSLVFIISGEMPLHRCTSGIEAPGAPDKRPREDLRGIVPDFFPVDPALRNH